MPITRKRLKPFMLFVLFVVDIFVAHSLTPCAQRLDDGIEPARQINPTSENSEQYFQDCSPENYGKQDCAILERFYSSRLKQLGEAPLLAEAIPHSNDIYRITIIFPVATVTAKVARIYQENDGSVTLSTIVSDQNGIVASTNKITLTGPRAEHLRAMLSWSTFLSVDTLEHNNFEHPTHQVRDEGFCLLEGLHDGKYHIVNRPIHKADEFNIKIYRYLDQLGIWSK